MSASPAATTSAETYGETIVVDPQFETSDSDSDYKTGSEYSTDSLTASIYEYRYENGRRYHAYKDGKYTLPNDEAEQDRLDIIHHIYLLLFDDKLHKAPISPNPQKILDIGTGTGIWAIDVAERYPSAQVIGTDLSPIQPSWVPPNVQFQIDDAEQEWTFGEDIFDLVHIRHLNGGIKDWGKLLKEAYRATKPGGWVDIAEYELFLWSDDGTLPKSTKLWQYYDKVNSAATKLGREFKVAANLDEYITDAGFIKMKHEQAKIPCGPWPADPKQKEMGAYLLLTCDNAFEAFGLALLTRVAGMPLEDVEELITGAKKDVKSKKVHSYSRQHLYYAQKPAHDHK